MDFINKDKYNQVNLNQFHNSLFDETYTEHQMEKNSELYHEQVKNIKYGYTEGKKSTHIIKKHGSGMIGKLKDAMHKGTNDIELVKQNENTAINVNPEQFQTKSAEIDRLHFTKLAQYSALQYQEFSTSEEVKNVMHQVREYITSDNIQDQRHELKELYKCIDTETNKLIKSGQGERVTMTAIGRLEMELRNLTDGQLNLNEQEKASLKSENYTEPSFKEQGAVMEDWKHYTLFGDQFTEQDAEWVNRKNEPLFLHTPSRTDIQEWDKTNNRYMMQEVGSILDQNPEYMRQSMKDLGDGFVAIRFYNFDQNNIAGPREVEYIKVKKSVARAKVDFMASQPCHTRAFWLEILKKGYSIYKKKHNIKVAQNAPEQDGEIFKNAFSEEAEGRLSLNLDISANDLEGATKPLSNRDSGMEGDTKPLSSHMSEKDN